MSDQGRGSMVAETSVEPPSWAPMPNRMPSADAAEAFVRRLCNEHGAAVFSWAVSRFEDRRDAEEVAAETMVRAWRWYHQYDPARGSERSWVFGIAKNTAIDHFRRGRRHLRVVSWDADAEREDALESSIEQATDASLVQDALHDLSAPHREALVLAYYGGLTVTEIATRLGVPAGTVKSRLYYAMRSLRTALEERGVLQ